MTGIGGFIVAPSYRGPRDLAVQELQTTPVGMMGHDFRQFLQIIQGTFALLRSRPVVLPERAWLDRGERAVGELAEQLDYMVDAFYLAERANELEVSPVALEHLFWRLRHANEDAATQRGIDLRVVATNINVVSNPVLLSCILRNLLTNAIKYTEPGGRILIGCRRRGAEVRIDVFDTGIGIPEARLPRIFDAFTQLTPGRGDGLGIGLSIVRRALDALGHRIEVRSMVGEGSLFSIYLPAAQAAAGAKGPQ
jgi:two-component system, OmpR family, phosphate regulon sensor histidine kinase PhoR